MCFILYKFIYRFNFDLLEDHYIWNYYYTVIVKIYVLLVIENCLDTDEFISCFSIAFNFHCTICKLNDHIIKLKLIKLMDVTWSVIHRLISDVDFKDSNNNMINISIAMIILQRYCFSLAKSIAGCNISLLLWVLILFVK